MSDSSHSEDDIYTVQEILAKRLNLGKTEYLIKWQGYEGQNTWEPLSNLKNVMNMVMAFDQGRKRVASPPPAIVQKSRSPSPLEGCYDEDDSAREVVNIRRDETTKSLWFQVSWKPRKDLRVPKPAWISDSMLKDHNPEVLCEFLVKKIKWPSK